MRWRKAEIMANTISVAEMIREVENGLNSLQNALYGLKGEAKRQNRFADGYVLDSLYEKLDKLNETFGNICFASKRNIEMLKKLSEENKEMLEKLSKENKNED